MNSASWIRWFSPGTGLFLSCFVATALWTLPCSAQAQYTLAAGDILEISVVGLPELRQKATVDLDGTVIFPVLGSVQAEGQSLGQLTATVRSRLGRTILQQRSGDGRSFPIVINENEVTLTVAEYRPVYLTGDVLQPGAQQFRPGITVRQAVSVASGLGSARLGVTSPFQMAQLRSDFESLWLQFVKDSAIAWRLQSEISKDRSLPFPDLSDSPLSPQITAEIRKVEIDQLNTRRMDEAKERASLESSIRQIDKRYAYLAEQLKNEEEGSRSDKADFERTTALFERGAGTVTRVSDARRAMLLSATRMLQTQSTMAQLERDRELQRRSLEAIDDKRRILVTTELQEVTGRIRQTKAKIQSTQSQIAYAGGLRFGAGTDDLKAELWVVRRTNGNAERTPADEDMRLMPGDVVEVKVAPAAGGFEAQ
jgi:polysaccharide export outer membrane protein